MNFFCLNEPFDQGYMYIEQVCFSEEINISTAHTAPQHLVFSVMQSLHTDHMQMGLIEVSICRRLLQ